MGDLAMSLNGHVPAWVMFPGIEMEVEVDPQGKAHPRFRERYRTRVPVRLVPEVTLHVIPFFWDKEETAYRMRWENFKKSLKLRAEFRS